MFPPKINKQIKKIVLLSYTEKNYSVQTDVSQANLAVQENRLKTAMLDLQKAQAELDAKQAELDVVQAEYEKAMREKQVGYFTSHRVDQR